MNRKLKSNVNICGIDMYGARALISQFADDTTLFLKNDKQTLENVVQTLELIERNTGLCINYDKTLMYRIGSISDSNAKMLVLKNYTGAKRSLNLLEYCFVTICHIW